MSCGRNNGGVVGLTWVWYVGMTQGVECMICILILTFLTSYLITLCAIVQQGLCVWFVAQFVDLSATFWVICMIKALSRACVAPER